MFELIGSMGKTPVTKKNSQYTLIMVHPAKDQNID